MADCYYHIENAKKVKSVVEKHKHPAPTLILSSPPYFDLLNYNDNKQQIGFGQKNYNEYLNVLCEVFQDCYTISSDNATFWLVIDTFKKNQEVKLLPFDIVNKLKEKYKKTWILRDIIIWDKEKNLPWNNNGNFRNQHEYILLFTKGNNFKFNLDTVRNVVDLKKWWKRYPERYSPNGKAPSNVWQFTTPIRGWGDSKQNHLCPFPFPLVEKILSISTDENDWVLDPFAGSGSVLAIAREMGRNAIGIDVNSEYKKRFKKEVLVGAKRYWDKRKLELIQGQVLSTNFKEINSKLRKLKVASNICAYINRINNYPFVYYTKEKASNKLELIVVENGRVPNIELVDEDLLALIKQSKVDHNIVTVKEKDFVAKIAEHKAFKYKLDKFYSYTSSCNIEKILSQEDKYDFMYSDIQVKMGNN